MAFLAIQVEWKCLSACGLHPLRDGLRIQLSMLEHYKANNKMGE